MRRVNVEGNGESIYHVMDEKKITTGMNRVECSRMNLFFEDNKVKKITFITKPEAKFIPPNEWTEELQFLDGFKWRDKEKVTLTYLLEHIKYTNTVKKP